MSEYDKLKRWRRFAYFLKIDVVTGLVRDPVATSSGSSSQTDGRNGQLCVGLLGSCDDAGTIGA